MIEDTKGEIKAVNLRYQRGNQSRESKILKGQSKP